MTDLPASAMKKPSTGKRGPSKERAAFLAKKKKLKATKGVPQRVITRGKKARRVAMGRRGVGEAEEGEEGQVNGPHRALGPGRKRPRADKYTRFREPYEPVNSLYEEEEDDILIAQSQNEQEDRLVKEVRERMLREMGGPEGTPPPPGAGVGTGAGEEVGFPVEDLWPDRDVRVDEEFTNVFPSELEQMKQEGLIKDGDDIEDVARALLAENVKTAKTSKKEKLFKMLPDYLKKAIPVDSLPDNKAVYAPEISPDDEPTTFGMIGLKHKHVVQALSDKYGINKPTPIQIAAIPQILTGTSAFVAAQTGTGKTLAYLLPLFERLLELEKVPGFRRRGQRTRALIVVPTRELATQTEGVVRTLLKVPTYAHMTANMMAGGTTKSRGEYIGFTKGLDILITTPERLSLHLEQRHLTLDDTRMVVVDEADTMFTYDSYQTNLDHLLEALDAVQSGPAPEPVQFVWVSATISRPVAKRMSKDWPDAVQIVSKNLHKSVEKLKQDFLYGASGNFKERLLFDTLRKYKGTRTMIFTNSMERSIYVHNLLKKKNILSGCITSDTSAKKRAKMFKEFASGELGLLVSTDLASRGIDTTVEVPHVLLYDFPTNVIDYLHRIGRTARADKDGVVTAFVQQKDQALVNNIREAFQRGESLANVSPIRDKRKIDKAKRRAERRKRETHITPLED
eukprot:TRINITY_DN9223_c0_g1_i1.p1 TRINITY_DN9223_c0_g1~~TRINITY_DN9223_c0_g1_i1.p1  ORF type:complete len:716 (+),score=191.85 TRINITY_DN9223_c0_g1_i1:107-2149(+)